MKILALCLILFVLISFAIYLVLYFKFNFIFNIKCKTIHLQRPKKNADGKFERKSFLKNESDEKLISSEFYLRNLAYKNTIIRTGESFFDDSDMNSEYYLIVIYEKKSSIPLLSARYYFDKTTIANYLRGDDNSDVIQSNYYKAFNINNFKEGEIFLADRLSGNINNSTYRLNRNYIFLMLYSEILIHNRERKFILMARKEKYEKLLTKYLRLGLNIVSSTKLRGKEHWILLGDVKKIYAQKKISLLSEIVLISKFWLSKFSRK